MREERNDLVVCVCCFFALILLDREAFSGYFVLFFVAHGILIVYSWVVIGVLFFLVGQACVG